MLLRGWTHLSCLSTDLETAVHINLWYLGKRSDHFSQVFISRNITHIKRALQSEYLLPHSPSLVLERKRKNNNEQTHEFCKQELHYCTSHPHPGCKAPEYAKTEVSKLGYFKWPQSGFWVGYCRWTCRLVNKTKNRHNCTFESFGVGHRESRPEYQYVVEGAKSISLK